MTTDAYDLAAAAPLSYADLAAAHRAGTLTATLAAMTPRERLGCYAEIALATGKTVGEVQRRAERLAAELDAAAERAAVRAQFEAAADRDAERIALAEALLTAGAEKAADYVARGGVSVERDGAAVVVRRPGGSEHRIVGERCSCQAAAHGRRCWAMDVEAATEPAGRIARRAA